MNQDDIDWIQGSINYHMDRMLIALTARKDKKLVDDGSFTPTECARLEASAIRYILDDVERNLRFGTPIQRIIFEETPDASQK